MAAGLFLIGTACGAAIRLMMFVVVLFGAALIAIVAGISHGVGVAVLDAVIAVVALQVGYAAGFVLRAVLRSRQVKAPQQVDHSRSTPATPRQMRR
ncbi:MAG TPA: hypothetical protein VNV38_12160 [Stellaceae bacterium]|nr:hypothetical protein [Stellaceae bacterium]